MTEITHQASRSEKEPELIMRECERATGLGGSFKIENKYTGIHSLRSITRRPSHEIVLSRVHP